MKQCRFSQESGVDEERMRLWWFSLAGVSAREFTSVLYHSWSGDGTATLHWLPKSLFWNNYRKKTEVEPANWGSCGRQRYGGGWWCAGTMRVEKLRNSVAWARFTWQMTAKTACAYTPLRLVVGLWSFSGFIQMFPFGRLSEVSSVNWSNHRKQDQLCNWN